MSFDSCKRLCNYYPDHRAESKSSLIIPLHPIALYLCPRQPLIYFMSLEISLHFGGSLCCLYQQLTPFINEQHSTEWICSFIHLFPAIRVVSSFRLLWLKLLWMLAYRPFYGGTFSFLLGAYIPRSGATESCVSFHGTQSKHFPSGGPLCLPSSSGWGSVCSAPSPAFRLPFSRAMAAQ